ncbi:hypothetical protein SEMRO_1474_G275690.1 [Seminavis robusta]|uniref:Uncharacterized protein n=1 Tax=Seminavis robusta TaxID=568900 RepID=A0A9N8EP74_9STRA|nr:hypothetical protein SEMRO_1474_G275690.1 [Seminavis robusta]|eukprot:Sro1474_g275690.1 n/a (809) ;mRNA; f:1003-3429
MIQVIDSSDTPCTPIHEPQNDQHEDDEDEQELGPVDERVEAALTALVKHYSDPIHATPRNVLSSSNLVIPPVVAHWVNELSQGKDINILIRQLIEGYPSHIRPVLLQQNAANHIFVEPTGIPVLQHYLLLIQQLRHHWHSKADNDNENNNDNSLRLANNSLLEISPISQDATHNKSNNEAPAFAAALSAMATDVSTCTKICVTLGEQEKEEEEKGEVSCHTVANTVLPTLIQIMTVSLDCINNPLLDDPTTLLKCAIALLAFGTNPRLDPRNVVPSLESILMVHRPHPAFLYTPIPALQTDTVSSSKDDEYFNLGFHWTEDNFWNQLQLDGRPWTTSRQTQDDILEEFWKQLHKRLLPQMMDRNNPQSSLLLIEEVGNPNTDDDKSSSQIMRECLQALGPTKVAKAVRAHFFARDVTPLLLAQDKLIDTRHYNKKTKLMLGWEVPVQQKDETLPDRKPYQDIPSRVHVVMHYILLLDENTVVKDSVLEEILPIIYELLGAFQTYYVGMGAAALIHLVMITANTTKMTPPPKNTSLALLSVEDTTTTTTTTDSFLFAKYAGSLLPVLDLACQTCREGPPFCLLARAQSLLCEAAAGDRPVFVKHRRQVTRYFLTLLDKYRHKVSDPDGLLWGLLVGGIIPLLQQHATLPECTTSIDALEVGRLGLQALLPIVRFSAGYRVDNDSTMTNDDKLNETRKLLGPSVLALTHLMQAAYPIMPRHGGKIMSELLGLLGNLQPQVTTTEQDGRLLELVKDAAGMALVICGERAEQVLEHVTTKDYQPGLVELACEIPVRADKWRHAQQKDGTECM